VPSGILSGWEAGTQFSKCGKPHDYNITTEDLRFYSSGDWHGLCFMIIYCCISQSLKQGCHNPQEFNLDIITNAGSEAYGTCHCERVFIATTENVLWGEVLDAASPWLTSGGRLAAGWIVLVPRLD
jgi:hypothetical protein